MASMQLQNRFRNDLSRAKGILLCPAFPYHGDTDRAHRLSPSFFAIPSEIGMRGMERIYQIDQILAGRQFVPRKELQERQGFCGQP